MCVHDKSNSNGMKLFLMKCFFFFNFFFNFFFFHFLKLFSFLLLNVAKKKKKYITATMFVEESPIS